MKAEELFSLLHQFRDVLGSVEVRGEVNAQELYAAHVPLLPTCREEGVKSSGPPIVNSVILLLFRIRLHLRLHCQIVNL